MSHESPQKYEAKEVQFPKVAEEILRMVAVDQDMRRQSLDDDALWNSEVDLKNTESMKWIIGAIGWPTVSKVGKQPSESAWLMVQHADHDPEFQMQCLKLMKLESAAEVNLADVAYLEDRVLVNTGQKQLYGTQFEDKKDESGRVVSYGPKPIEAPEAVNERRLSMGLETHEEYTQHLMKKYFPNGFN